MRLFPLTGYNTWPRDEDVGSQRAQSMRDLDSPGPWPEEISGQSL